MLALKHQCHSSSNEVTRIELIAKDCRKRGGELQLKIRESDMPKEEEWAQFFDPGQALRLIGLDRGVVNVADFGCGYGTFTIPAAKIIAGKIYAFDIEPEMIEVVKQKAKL